MTQESSVESREMWSWCCGARSWALIIGWGQIIFSAIAGIAIYTLFILEIENPQPGYGFHNSLLALFIAVYIGLATLFAAGIVLVVGVKQANAGKLKIWIVIQIIFLFLNIITLNLVTIAIAGFSLWVVHVHRQEIINTVTSSEKYNYYH